MPEENPTNQPPEEDVLRQVELTIPYPDSFLYSNAATFSVSLMDIRIVFAEVMPNGKVEARSGVVMAPEQAAVLAMMLMAQINAYEKSFGKIRDPRWRDFTERANKLQEQA